MKKFFAVLLLAILFFGWWGTRVQPGVIEIAPGDSVSAAAQKLVAAKIIRIGFLIRPFIKHVYPGAVAVPANCNFLCVAHLFDSPADTAVRITIPEGSDLRDIQKIIATVDPSGAKKLYALVGTPAKIGGADKKYRSEFSFLKDAPDTISLEGYLFPDTYYYDAKGLGVDGLVHTMLDNFGRRTNGRASHDVVTVASILEKEVRSEADRKMVADIIWRRLKMGMALQFDSTVSYASARDSVYTTALERKSNSPWNTYAARGLPIGPISNPGLDAIEAAENPTPNNYIFFLVGPDGVAHYARTLDEQIANKKYLK